MTNLKFRDLRADEIDCRIGQIGKDGSYITLLLYKDARCDMNILDETVGAENWQRNHEIINGNLFCNVGIKTDDGWVWKQDVGTESKTEAEKGEASDSFKRACVNWGIGRELYTAPRIQLWANSNAYKVSGGKCYDKFVVTAINIKDKRIIGIEIANESRSGETVFTFGTIDKEADPVKTWWFSLTDGGKKYCLNHYLGGIDCQEMNREKMEIAYNAMQEEKAKKESKE